MLKGAKGCPDNNPIGYINTLLEYHLGINPKELSNKAWAEKFAQLVEIRKREGKPLNVKL
ncbi:conserved hypothetical protein [Tenacibaculum maritimum]|nr:conserved hypothetical protein [Tenacibaculum maritimum]